jgi:mono/diheme cytochrome c family protein
VIAHPGNHSTSPPDTLDVQVADESNRRSSTRRRPPPRRLALASLVTAAVIVAAACGSGSSDSLSEAGARGRRVSTSNGCASCHGPDGQGGVGPKWVGLAGSEVTLESGEKVVADDAYLERAIKDPGAQLVAGYSIQMPTNGLTDAEVADVIAYIHDLSPTGSESTRGGGLGGGGGDG